MEIIDILRGHVGPAVVEKRRTALGDFPRPIEVDFVIVRDHEFDIKDCKDDGEVVCPRTDDDRVATYLNGTAEDPYELMFVKYENFIKQFTIPGVGDWAHGIRRVDYIVLTPGEHRHFIVHEVSKGKIESKKCDAKNQFIRTVNLLRSVPEMRGYMDGFAKVRCFVSARGCDDVPRTPRNVARGFIASYRVVPNPVEITVPSLKKNNISVFKGNIVKVD